jgi:hypothetical protein
MVGLSVGLLLLGWLGGAVLKLSLTTAGEGQIAQYGPSVTGNGSDVSAQAVPSNVS